MPDLDQEWVNRRRADPLRSAGREQRPDVALDALSDDPLTAAWQRWDARPTNADRVEALLAAQTAVAAQLGTTAVRLHEAVCFRMRSWLDLEDAIASVCSDLQAGRSVYSR